MRRSEAHKLLKEALQDNGKKYKTTEDELVYWFGILNAVIFRGQIRRYFNDVKIRRKRDVWAHFTGAVSDTTKSLQEKLDGNGIVCRLDISANFPNRRTFIEVLAHEMVHLYQFVHTRPRFSSYEHDKSFWRWKDTFKKYGLKLKLGYPV